MPRTRLALPVFVFTFLASLLCESVLAAQWGPVEVAGRKIWPGETLRFPYGGESSFESAYLDAPVFVARGSRHGPRWEPAQNSGEPFLGTGSTGIHALMPRPCTL